jgi:hypothetical protein
MNAVDKMKSFTQKLDKRRRFFRLLYVTGGTKEGMTAILTNAYGDIVDSDELLCPPVVVSLFRIQTRIEMAVDLVRCSPGAIKDEPIL